MNFHESEFFFDIAKPSMDSEGGFEMGKERK